MIKLGEIFLILSAHLIGDSWLGTLSTSFFVWTPEFKKKNALEEAKCHVFAYNVEHMIF